MKFKPAFLSLISVFFMFITGPSALALTQDVIFNLESGKVMLAPGRVETLKIKTILPKGFHAYSDKFKITKISAPGFEMGQVKVLNEVDFFDKFTKKNRKGLAESGWITAQIETPIDFNNTLKEFHFNLTYQICSEKICFLSKMQTINVKIEMAKTTSTAIITSSNVVHKMTDASLIDRLQSALADNVFYAFLIAFLAGILTSFTPCIFPMIPITISILGHDAEKNSRAENLLRSVLYVLGIALTYSLLGVLAALTGNLFGNALSNKYVLITMVILFFTMALSMWGLFELQVPAFIRNKLGVGTNKHGYFGIFVSGLFAGIVASPCVGPVLVSILSYVSTTKDALLGFGLLFTYAIGLGLIFIAIGLFGQFLSLLPRSGAWMNKIKFVLGLLMLLTGIYYLRLAFPGSDNIKSTMWRTYTEDRLADAKSKQIPVMIDFRADWCMACLEMEEKTFSRAEFEEASKIFMLLKVDATEETPEIEVILKKYDVKGLPTMVFVNRNGDVLNNLTFTQFLEWPALEPKMIEASKK
ncbi:MAG: thioredoxin family protein [Bdellovibrionaceae bacterium]|nr:thioredoxin family protein [Pseudobdellovibrionaceae bacterium]